MTWRKELGSCLPAPPCSGHGMRGSGVSLILFCILVALTSVGHQLLLGRRDVSGSVHSVVAQCFARDRAVRVLRNLLSVEVWEIGCGHT